MSELLYGRDYEKNIVGVRKHGQNEMAVYTRDADGFIEERIEPFYPFMFLSDEGAKILDENYVRLQGCKLDGPGHFTQLRILPSWRDHWEASKIMRRAEDAKRAERMQDELHFRITSPVTQYLMQTGKTLFGGMSLDDVHRMQVDIEVFSSRGGFVNAKREEDRIIICTFKDNRGWGKLICLRPPNVGDDWEPPTVRGTTEPVEIMKDEADLLLGIVKEIHRRDPDVIELHNGYGFDLPYIRDRCQRYRVPFAIGRDKSEPRTWPSKKKFAERDFEFEAFAVNGRSVIDTMFLAVDYDVIKRDLPGIGLKTVAQHFGVAPEDRVYIDGDKIAWYWENDPDTLLQYAMDDVIETEAIGKRLSASTFALTQMLPMEYQAVANAGSAGAIQNLFIREYLTKRQSLPLPEIGKQEHGGLVELYRRGVVGPIVYADVASLYPSIMLEYGVAPESDSLGIFRELLESLTELRLTVKAEMNALADENGNPLPGHEIQHSTLDAQQGAIKIIINSFYGMLGFSRFGIFNDISEADRVAETGQLLLTQMMKIIHEFGGEVVECDTDGVIYIPREEIRDDLDAQREEVAEISRRMPKGINIDLEGLFKVMLSYKKKNYMLVDYNGKVKTKGGSFKNRGLEPYGRRYLKEQANALLERNVQKMWEIHEKYKSMIINREWTADDFSRRAQLKRTIHAYDQRREDNNNINPAAAYEIARGIEERTGRKAMSGDVVEFFVAGDKPQSRVRVYIDAMPKDSWEFGQENSAWYLKRLQVMAKKFEQFFTKEDFGTLFAKTVYDGAQIDLLDVPNNSHILDKIDILDTQVKKNVSFP